MSSPESSFYTEYKLPILLGIPVLLGMAALTLYPSDVLRWIQRKRYQYEVTFGPYMMTPTERFICNSILFLFLAMVSIAASLYLPGHIATMIRRAYWYLLGDTEALHASLKSPSSVAELAQAVKENLGAVTSSISSAATSSIETVGRGGEL